MITRVRIQPVRNAEKEGDMAATSASFIEKLFEREQFQACLFDLDGVLTPTAALHMRAWRRMFSLYFGEHNVAPPYTDADYYKHVDGRPRYDGVRAVLHSRGVDLPTGHPSDAADAGSICGLGNTKNDMFDNLVAAEGVAAYPGTVQLLDELAKRAVPLGVVTSSRNASEVLAAAHLADRFAVTVDGLVAEHEHLRGKPSGDTFVFAAGLLSTPVERCVVFEDAVSGVSAGRDGGFGLVVGVDRGAGREALKAAGAHLVVGDLGELAGHNS